MVYVGMFAFLHFLSLASFVYLGRQFVNSRNKLRANGLVKKNVNELLNRLEVN
jgi:hypothetical protein